MLCVLSVIIPVIKGPKIEEPLSVTEKREKNVVSFPVGINIENTERQSVFKPPRENPYQAAKSTFPQDVAVPGME